MSALFEKTASGVGKKTLLLVDIENGSVASALVQLSATQLPKLFAEYRIPLPVLRSVSSDEIARRVKAAVEESVGYTGEVAARMRQDEKLASLADIKGAQLFFGPPWATASREEGRIRWSFEPSVVDDIKQSAHSVVGEQKVDFHPFGRAAAHVAGTLVTGRLLVCVITGEVVELLLVENGRLLGRATVPMGIHTILRTLTVHANLSTHEARSVFRLYQLGQEHLPELAQTIQAAADHFVDRFTEAAEVLLAAHKVETIAVVAQEPMGEWFARTLAGHQKIARLFPNGGVTRDIRAKHLMPYIGAHSTTPDVHLMIEALFSNSQLATRGIQ